MPLSTSTCTVMLCMFAVAVNPSIALRRAAEKVTSVFCWVTNIILDWIAGLGVCWTRKQTFQPWSQVVQPEVVRYGNDARVPDLIAVIYRQVDACHTTQQ